MGRKILITGAQGFVGSKLVVSLSQEGHQVCGPELDIHEWASIWKTVKQEAWDVVIHLAALSHMPTCENEPSKAFQTNLNGTALLLEAVRRHCPKSHFIFASSAQIYARPEGREADDGVVFDESRKVVPQNIYAQTKWGSELLLEDAARREGLRVTCLRLFNHTHKTHGPDFFLPYLYHLMKTKARGESLTIPVGNLDVKRDIGSSQDLVRAFSSLIKMPPQNEKPEIFNLCSGTAKHLGTLARKLAAKLELKVDYIVDPARVRKGEPTSICGSHRKFSEATGWTPKAQTEDDLIEAFLQ